MGYRPVEFRIHIVIGIQKIQFNTSYIHSPYGSIYLIIQIRYFYNHRVAIGIQLTFNRQATEILCFVICNLLPVHGQSLRKITITIKETDCTHIYVAIGSLFQIITGQYSQTTGIYLQHVIQTVLHTEISYRRTCLVRLYVHVFTECGIYVVHFTYDRTVFRQFLHLLIAETFQQQHRILSHFVKQVFIQTAEQHASIMVPRPPHITS